jgi:beta-lactamase regulating signal transducer with metallopeptidase domain
VDLNTILWIVAIVLLVAYLYVRSRRKSKEKKYRDY